VREGGREGGRTGCGFGGIYTERSGVDDVGACVCCRGMMTDERERIIKNERFCFTDGVFVSCFVLCFRCLWNEKKREKLPNYSR